MILTEEQEEYHRSQDAIDKHGRLKHAAMKHVPPTPLTISRVPSGNEVSIVEDDDYSVPLQRVETGAFPVDIEWKSGGRKVYVTGPFTNWQSMIPMEKHQDTGAFQTTIYLRPGTHRLKFVVDGELKYQNTYPTATDSVGNLFNYIEIGDDGRMYSTDSDKSETESNSQRHIDHTQERSNISIDVENVVDKIDTSLDAADDPRGPKFEYTTEIPEACLHPDQVDEIMGDSFVAPPFLPPHLENAVVNSMNSTKDDSSVLPVPNHVVINHLATTSIKHNVLSVASTCRYSRKFVTQILYAPL